MTSVCGGLFFVPHPLVCDVTCDMCFDVLLLELQSEQSGRGGHDVQQLEEGGLHVQLFHLPAGCLDGQ